jgi:hypothetical protein
LTKNSKHYFLKTLFTPKRMVVFWSKFFFSEYTLKHLVIPHFADFHFISFLIRDFCNFKRRFVKEMPNVVRFEVKSRHVNKNVYRAYVKYVPGGSGISAILGHCCECANGQRTIGCCSHVAAAIYYLAHGRYLQKIIRPASILSTLFETNQFQPIINDDSDDD